MSAYPRDLCLECFGRYRPRTVDQRFCCRACRKLFNNRRAARGAELIDFAMVWRGKRIKGGFTKLCRLIDGWLQEDRERRRAAKLQRERMTL